MTQTAAICKALLKGEVLSIMDGFKMFACTNLPRELSRSVEQKFGVKISKDPTKFKSKYGQSGVYYRYRLNRIAENQEGIEKMVAYVLEQEGAPKTEKQEKEQKQIALTNHSPKKYIEQSLF